jgi:putative tryptophan/tyrosine transport system substrate-binding protein
MSYSVSTTDLFRRAAGLVDKIFKGTKPADIPLERPTKLELLVNLKTAKILDLQIPDTLLARADNVIEQPRLSPLLALFGLSAMFDLSP